MNRGQGEIGGDPVTWFGARRWDEREFRYFDTTDHIAGRDATDDVLALHDGQLIIIRWVRFENNKATTPWTNQ